MQEKLLTVKQVAERLNVHHKTVYKLIKQKRIKTVRLGWLIRIKEEDYQRFIGGK